jgi:hypothetical protein
VPHNWESRALFEEATGTLFCGDLGTQLGDGPGVTEDDIIEAALTAEAAFRQMSCLTAATATMRTMAELSPRTLAIMHGSSYTGDGGAMLKTLADSYEDRFMPELSFAMDRGEATGPPPEKGGAAAVQVSEESSDPPPEIG